MNQKSNPSDPKALPELFELLKANVAQLQEAITASWRAQTTGQSVSVTFQADTRPQVQVSPSDGAKLTADASLKWMDKQVKILIDSVRQICPGECRYEKEAAANTIEEGYARIREAQQAPTTDLKYILDLSNAVSGFAASLDTMQHSLTHLTKSSPSRQKEEARRVSDDKDCEIDSETPNIGHLKNVLAEVIVVILFVKFLEAVLVNLDNLKWEVLVLPVSILLL
jgi:hypothetical protein